MLPVFGALQLVPDQVRKVGHEVRVALQLDEHSCALFTSQKLANAKIGECLSCVSFELKGWDDFSFKEVKAYGEGIGHDDGMLPVRTAGWMMLDISVELISDCIIRITRRREYVQVLAQQRRAVGIAGLTLETEVSIMKIFYWKGWRKNRGKHLYDLGVCGGRSMWLIDAPTFSESKPS